MRIEIFRKLDKVFQSIDFYEIRNSVLYKEELENIYKLVIETNFDKLETEEKNRVIENIDKRIEKLKQSIKE